jgi:hypothetical protein
VNCCDYNCTQGHNCPARVAPYKPVCKAQRRPVEADIEHDEYVNAFRISVAIIAGAAVLAFAAGFVFERLCA